MTQYKRRKINIYDHMNEIVKELKKGVTLTTKSGNCINTMTISWGAIGIEWGRPIFTTYIRHSRYSKELLDASNVFSVNIPVEIRPNKAISYVGKHSGRDEDKFVAANLTPINGVTIDVPAIVELPLTLECKVVFKQDQVLNLIPESFIEKYYPIDVTSSADGMKNIHTQYMGEIVDAYILEPDEENI